MIEYSLEYGYNKEKHMIQKRSNPLDAQNAPAEQPAEAAVSAEEITPVEAATPADNVKPVEQKELQKRVNPLTLEERPQIVETPLPAPAKAPTTIIGKTKKKRVMSKVNKTLLLSLIAKTGKKAGEMLDAAMLAYAFSAYPELFESFEKSLKAKGCDLK